MLSLWLINYLVSHLLLFNGFPLPHPDAQAFEVKDADGSHLGVLYMDFYPRESKQQGAWCGTYRNYHVVTERELHPVVTTVFNFTSPSGDLPALLSLEEVRLCITSSVMHWMHCSIKVPIIRHILPGILLNCLLS